MDSINLTTIVWIIAIAITGYVAFKKSLEASK
jgi:hypothetical protein